MIRKITTNQEQQHLKEEFPSEEIQGEEIMKYFFLVGNTPSEFTSPDFINTLNPRIISSYSIEGDSIEFRQLKHLINTDSLTRNTIFPTKIDYLNTIEDAADFDELEEKIIIPHTTPFYKKHAYYSKDEKQRKPHIYHCQLIKSYLDPYFFEWYFHILLFYEDVRYANGEFLFAPKTMIIITHEPYMTLVKNILEKIYLQCLVGLKSTDISSNKKEHTYIPIELYIVQYFQNIKRVANSFKTTIAISPSITYQIYNIPFLKVLDLNLSMFFQIVDLNECLFLMHKKIKTETLIISSPYLAYLCPVYIIIEALLHPLDISDNTYTYKFVTIEIIKTMHLPIPSMLFVYSNKLSDKFLKSLCLVKQTDITYMHINRNDKGQIYTTKCIYKYQGDDEDVRKETGFPKDNLIKSVVYFKDPNLISLSQILGEIRQMMINESNAPKTITPSIFTQGDYVFIQKLFFGTMVNFFSTLIPKIYYKLKNNKMQIDIKVNHELDVKYNIRGIETAPINDLLYNDKITENSPDLKTRILFTEILKITKKDEARIYFDDSNSNMPSDIYTQDLSELLMLDFQQFFFLNKYNRFLQRELNNNKIILENVYCDYKERHYINYHSIMFYFNFMDKKQIQQHKNNTLYLELSIFYYLYLSNAIPIASKKEIAAALVGTVLTIVIEYELRASNIPFVNVYNKVLQLFTLFKETQGFYQKFNFLLCFLYDIVSSDDRLNEFKQQIFPLFETLSIDIPLSMWIRVKNEEQNKTYKVINKKQKRNIDIQILHIEKVNNDLNDHQHVFDFEGDLNGHFVCINCVSAIPEQLYYNITLKIKEEFINKNEVLINPKFIFDEVLKNLIKLGSEESIILEDINKFYKEWKDHLLQTALIAKEYFNIDLFQITTTQ